MAVSKAALPKVWSKWTCVLTTWRDHDVPAEAADVVEHLAALDVARPRVDDDRAVATEHEADVDVPLAVARDEDPVGDLREPTPRCGSHGRSCAVMPVSGRVPSSM